MSNLTPKNRTAEFDGKVYRVFTISFLGKKVNIILVPALYQYNNRLGVYAMKVTRNGNLKEWNVLTENFPEEEIKEDQAFVDTGNNPWFNELIAVESFATYVGKIKSSGFNTYPLYRWNKKALLAE